MQFIPQILMPGQPAQLCGRAELAEEDFWEANWGRRPPFYADDDEQAELELEPETPDSGASVDLPPELLDVLTQLWRIERPIHAQILPRDAWVALGVIQYSTRNPQLTAVHQQIIRQFGEQL